MKITMMRKMKMENILIMKKWMDPINNCVSIYIITTINTDKCKDVLGLNLLNPWK